MRNHQANDIKIILIPAFIDNYIWLIHNGTVAAVVDPGDADVVHKALAQLNLNLTTILITHYHHDHIDGVASLLARYPNTSIYAPKRERYQFEHTQIGEPDIIKLSDLNLNLAVIDTPGHTLDHVAYYFEPDNQSNVLFCGDTLFGAGCGRLFEGTPEQMFSSLQKLAALPQNTKVYCAHEYTLHNINFALTLEPNNTTLIERYKSALELRIKQQPSIPSTIKLELATNPFLRCASQEIQSKIQLENAPLSQVFSAIRELRNHY